MGEKYIKATTTKQNVGTSEGLIREMFGNVCLDLGQILENLPKVVWKILSNKKKNTRSL